MIRTGLFAALIALGGAGVAQAADVRVEGDHESRHLVYEATRPAVVGGAVARITGDAGSRNVVADRVVRQQAPGPVGWMVGGGSETQVVYGSPQG